MKHARPLIALMTDFGLTDPYVGIMKGVIAGISPSSSVIDLTHGIQPQNVLQGALQLGISLHYFPEGTVFVAVVDPGVGTARNALCVVSENRYFIAPDNGLLTKLLDSSSMAASFAITNPDVMLPLRSNTFHGRDVFAPAAAHLANGIDPSHLGKTIHPDRCKRIALPRNSSPDDGRSWNGTILFADVYGNLVTSLTDDLLGKGRVKGILTENGILLPFHRTYGDVNVGEKLSCRGSGGFLEIAIRNGNAAAELGLQPGEKVVLAFEPADR